MVLLLGRASMACHQACVDTLPHRVTLVSVLERV